MARQDWDNLRVDIEQIALTEKIKSKDFRPGNLHDNWKEIEEKIYNTFCKLDHPTVRPIWLWEHFKLDTFSLKIDRPDKYLDKLIDTNESVWFFVNSDRDKFWFYESKVTAIMTIVSNSSYIDELYIASKKYDWLICINHHDDLIGTGKAIPDKLRQLQQFV